MRYFSMSGNHFSKIRVFVFWFFPLMLLLSGTALGQRIQIRMGNTQIARNELFTITLTVEGAALNDIGNFPEIPGFSKAGTSSSTSMRSINGSVSQEHSIIQNYLPEKEGSFVLAPFSMKVNGRLVRSSGGRLQVGPPKDLQARQQNPFAADPFDDLFNRNDNIPQDVKADAFFSVRADKKEVWAGEGVNITMSFLVSEQNQAELNFYEIGNQLIRLAKSIKPANCWEENFGIEEIEQRKISIGNKNYTEYRFYQAVLFPQTPGKWEIPALKLEMLQLSGGYFNGKETVRPFVSAPVSILVKDLPEHPMKGRASVGVFQLQEKAGTSQAIINQGFGYDFNIQGEGNISYIQAPEQLSSSLLDIYPPNSQQVIQRAGGRVTGSKTFSYLIVPKEQESVRIGKSIFWVFFNTQTGRYDSLIPRTVLPVGKSRKKGEGASAENEDSFFSLLNRVDDSPADLSERKSQSLFWYNLAIGAMALVSLIFMFRRKKEG
jgi:hypothetical protein